MTGNRDKEEETEVHVRPVFRPDLSLGNLITIVTVIIGLVTTWTAMAARLTQVEKDTTALTAKVEKQAVDTANDKLLYTRVLAEIQTDMRYIRGQLDRVLGGATRP